MRLGGRVIAAGEVLADIDSRKRPAADALKDWGLAHRFAGSGDRSAIGNLVYDVLRKKLSLGYRAGADDPAALLTSLLLTDWKLSADEVNAAYRDDKFAPEAIDQDQATKILATAIDKAELHIQADVPPWCCDSLEANFAEAWIEEGQALAARPPLDLRVNTLKTSREKVLKRLGGGRFVPTQIARFGIRVESDQGASRLPNVQAEEGYRKGWFEIQDQGSQIVSDLIYAQAGEKVLDYCAGAGGKTLALSASMENRGQIHAYDIDKNRLAPIHERLKRAGTRNVQVHAPNTDLSPLVGAMNRVVVDAPCTGSGTWRRRPDAKWRMDVNNLESRIDEQEQVLDQASQYVRPGGYLIYITCSVFPEENENQVYAFTDRHPNFELVSAGEAWEELFGAANAKPWSSDMKTVTLTPASTGTDGFFFAVLERRT